LMGASLKLFGRFTAAGITRSHREVGGDYYDLIQTAENSAALCIADVMGKGIGAALLMANMQAHYRNLIERGLGPAALMQALNRTVSDSAANGKLVSMIAARLDINSGKLSYSNAGHPPGIIVRSNGHAELLSTEDAILGALSSWTYKERECILESGDRLVLATDGFFEAASADGQEVGAEKLIEWCIDAKTLPAPELLTHLNRKLDDFCDAQLCDDATLLVVSAE
jgi:sigma-B regulation protein RsbU (phosphoserine phosphatase)